MPPSFIATAGVTFGFTGASNSTARTIPSAAAVFLAVAVFDITGDTIASTIAGAAPKESYQGGLGSGEGTYLAVFVGAPSGSQTVVVSGGDAGDLFSCGYRGVDSIDTVDPFDGNVTDTASPASISVVTTSDGLAVGSVYAEASSVTTSDTEVFEGPDQGPGVVLAVASSPGTGGSVSLDWSGGVTLQVSIAVNLRNGAPDPHANEQRVFVSVMLDGWGD